MMWQNFKRGMWVIAGVLGVATGAWAASQAITVIQKPPVAAVSGDSFVTSATSSSGLTVTITAWGACTGGGASPATITMTGAPCTVLYDQAGDSSYDPAPQKAYSVPRQTCGAGQQLSDNMCLDLLSAVPEAVIADPLNLPSTVTAQTCLDRTNLNPADSGNCGGLPGMGKTCVNGQKYCRAGAAATLTAFAPPACTNCNFHKFLQPPAPTNPFHYRIVEVRTRVNTTAKFYLDLSDINPGSTYKPYVVGCQTGKGTFYKPSSDQYNQIAPATGALTDPPPPGHTNFGSALTCYSLPSGNIDGSMPRSDTVANRGYWIKFVPNPDEYGDNYNTIMFLLQESPLPTGARTTPFEVIYVVVNVEGPSTLSTQASPSVPYGGDIYATASLGGGVSPTGTITFKLFGPDDPSCTGTPLLTSISLVSGAGGDFASEVFTPASTGVYRWTAEYKGDDTNNSAVTNCSDPTAAVNIAAAPLSITANNATKTFDGLPYSGGNGVAYSGLVNGETAAVLGGALAYGGTSQGAVNAGSYTIIPGGLTSANYTIGYVNGTLSILDVTPDTFGFTAQTGVALNTVATSNTITVAGINAAAAISIAGGTYSINGGGYTSAAVTVNNGNTVTVQQTASASNSTTTTATLTIGGVSGAFNVTTLATTSYTGATATGTGNATAIVSGEGCNFTAAQFVPAVNPPAGVAFPHGLFDFNLGGCTQSSTVTLDITYPSAVPAGTQYWKYGPTPSNHTSHWYTIPAIISGNTITFSITDGEEGDDDYTANGVIADAGGPGVQAAQATPTAIPTLSEWGVILVAGMLGVFGVAGVRRTTNRANW